MNYVDMGKKIKHLLFHLNLFAKQNIFLVPLYAFQYQNFENKQFNSGLYQIKIFFYILSESVSEILEVLTYMKNFLIKFLMINKYM